MICECENPNHPGRMSLCGCYMCPKCDMRYTCYGGKFKNFSTEITNQLNYTMVQLPKLYINNYIEQATKTESPSTDELKARLCDDLSIRLLHAAIGMCTESGEFIDMMKKHIFYGKPLDLVNLKEELGDMLWYIAVAMDALDTDFESEMKRNIAKLSARYPDKFSERDAVTRNLDAERQILESH